jgi:hypothetical protein
VAKVMLKEKMERRELFQERMQREQRPRRRVGPRLR